jgi:hypothetical protein
VTRQSNSLRSDAAQDFASFLLRTLVSSRERPRLCDRSFASCIRVRGEAVHHTGNTTITDVFRAQVDQKPQFAIRQPQVSQELLFVYPSRRWI